MDFDPSPSPVPEASACGAPPASALPVFISHSSVDALAAGQICSALEAAGILCWIAPRDIPAGAEYNAAIMDGLNRCRALLLVYSRHAAASDPVLREVERATNRKATVIPVRIAEAPIAQGLEYLIASRQWVDATTPPLDRHLPEICAAVQRSLGMQPEVPPQAAGGVPEFIGRYRVLDVLGEGGMGSVYRAEQRVPIRRVVAIKLIKAGCDTKEVIARFESERQALARMDHPHVAKVLDAGTDDRGRPFFVMEYIPGRPITQFADEHKLTVAQRLELFIQVCEAVAHAHTKGLIHRDIKSSNVLACLADGQPMAKVIDFGVAKALTGDRLTDRTMATTSGEVLGTYDSMSPEQAAGSVDIDTRSDVYSLGALLYELLTGAKPFDDTTLSRAADEEKRRIIREVDPLRPSTRLTGMGEKATGVAEARRAKLEALAGTLKRELEWIPLKALRKERDRRYPSPLALADDVRNYLAGRPLVAAPESRLYRLRKWAARNRGALLTAAAFLALLTAAVGTYIQGIRAEHARTVLARDEALRQKDLAEQARRLADQNADTARTQARLSLQIINSVIFDIQRGLENVPGALDVRRHILKTAVDGLNQVVRFSEGARVDHNMAAALVETGDVLMRLGGTEQDAVSTARQFYQQAFTIAQKLADADAHDLQGVVGLSVVSQRLGDVALQLGQSTAARTQYEEALKLAQRVADASPQDAQAQRNRAVLYQKLGNAALQLGQVAEAQQHYRQFLALATKLADADPRDAQAQRDVSVAYNKLGDVALQLGQSAEAQSYYEKSLAIAQQRTAADPRDAQAQRDLTVTYDNLGDLTAQLGRNADALRYFQEALAIARKLADADPHDAQNQRGLSIALHKVGDLTLQLGQMADALQFYQDGLAITQRLAQANPHQVQTQRDLSISYSKLGSLCLVREKPAEARQYFQDCLAIRQKLADADPHDAETRRDLLLAHHRLGDVLRQLGQAAAAQQEYEAGLQLARQAAAANPDDFQARRDLSLSYNRLGDLLQKQGRTAEALEYCTADLAIAKQLAAADAHDSQAQRDLAISYNRLGEVELQNGQIADALRDFQAHLALVQKRADADPHNAQARSELGVATRRIAYCNDAVVALSGLEAIDKADPARRTWLLYVRCAELAHRGDLPAVAASADRLRALAAKNAYDLYAAACGYGMCVRILDTPPVGGTFVAGVAPRTLPAEQQTQRKKYLDLALDTLRAAVAAGFKSTASLKTKDDLAALRALPEFSQLLQSIPEK